MTHLSISHLCFRLENDKLKQLLKQKDEEAVQTRATLERFANAVSKKPTNMPRPLLQQQQVLNKWNTN